MIQPTTHTGRDALAALVADPDGALIAFDYDGTLSPIVADPAQARPQSEIVAALVALSARIGRVAVVTGRPAKLAVDLAEFDTTPGLESLVVIGHYGMERWEGSTGRLVTIDPPPGLAELRLRLPELLSSLDLDDAPIEDKGLSVAVHVRGLTDPDQAFDRLRVPLEALASDHGLVAEPGRFVIEVRPGGMDKGIALRTLVEEVAPRAVVFVGDDLGDLAAFAEVDRLRGEGISGLLVCSGSAEVTALAEQADLVVDGPDGVAAFVQDLTTAIDSA